MGQNHRLDAGGCHNRGVGVVGYRPGTATPEPDIWAHRRIGNRLTKEGEALRPLPFHVHRQTAGRP